jgi:hypothetical protein
MRRYWDEHTPTDGQIIIFVAVVAVALMGMLGLATDLGYSFAQKRSAQSAADAAALAGTRAVTQWSTTNTTVTALPTVQKIVSANDMGNATQNTTCFYVDDKNKDLADCSAKVPATATGVQVQVSETHSTFFIWIIPGAPKTVTTRAVATAHAQIVQPDGSGAPFIICGASANLVSGGSEVTILQQQSDGTYTINPAAVGQTFEIHGKIDDCGAGSNRFKGLALGSQNAGKTVPGWFNGDNGEKTGPANEVVNGIDGCGKTTVDPYGCVMYLPMALENPPYAPIKSGSSDLFYIVGYGAFQVSSCSGSCKHEATLLGKYLVQTPSALSGWTAGSWTLGQNGIIAIRLTQ